MGFHISLLKKYTLLFILFITVPPLYSQFFPNNSTYFTGALTGGNYVGIDLQLNYLLEEKYSFRIGYSGHLRDPKSAPYDYNSGFLGTISFGLKHPFDKLGNYHLIAGKVYPLNDKGTIRFNPGLGLGLVVIKEPTNWQESERGIVYQNYTYDYHKYYTLGLILNPKIEFPLSRFYGFTISPMLQINKDRTYVGIGIGQMLGPLR